MSISLHPDTPEGRTLAASPVAGAASAAGPAGKKIRSRLFTKYVALFVAVVAVALLSNGIFEVFFYYREHKAALIRVQHEQAEAAAAKISQFVKEIESQLGWTTQLPWSAGSIRIGGSMLCGCSGGARHHRTGAGRLHRQGAAAGIAPCDGRPRWRQRFFQGAEVYRGGRPQGLLRPGVFPPRSPSPT